MTKEKLMELLNQVPPPEWRLESDGIVADVGSYRFCLEQFNSAGTKYLLYLDEHAEEVTIPGA